MTEDGTVRVRSQDVVWREVEGEVIVLDTRTSLYLSVNGSGRQLWEDLVAGTTRAKLVDRLATTFEIDPPRAATDVDAFLAQLAEHDLLAS